MRGDCLSLHPSRIPRFPSQPITELIPRSLQLSHAPSIKTLYAFIYITIYMLKQCRRLPRYPLSNLPQTRHIADLRPFQPGDLVLLRQKLDRSAPPILTRPLLPGRQVQSHRGVIRHDDLIGKRARDIVLTTHTNRNGGPGKLGTEYRLHEVKLEEYVRLSRRLVTPVYPADARLIVELLDVHPSLTDESNGTENEKLEILEAGTGHGALTLYLSRAIHAANPPLPTDESDDALATWKRSRRALIHTLDVSEKYSLHARAVVRGFRHGLYAPNIDFHTADLASWLRAEHASRSATPFLSHAILDLPSAQQHVADVAKALRVDGTLVVFNPSITQILQCASRIREEGVALEMERVVELPTNGQAGGREWDVRAVRPRALSKAAEIADDHVISTEGAEHEVEGESSGAIVDSSDDAEVNGVKERHIAAPRAKDDGWQMVCRPKVGDRIVGGGFVGVWKKQRDRS